MAADVVVSVPADTSYLALVRSVFAHAGVPHDLSVENIYGLRIAVSEACAILLTAVPAASTLTLRVTLGDVWEVEAAVDADSHEWPPRVPLTELPSAVSLLGAFADEVHLERGTDGCPRVRFRKRVA